MATSQYTPQTDGELYITCDPAEMVIAVVVSDWNPNVTYNMLDGAVDTLKSYGVKEENILVQHVPGSFELVFAANAYLNGMVPGLPVGAEEVDAVIVLGCVVRGETPHFDYVCQGVTQGISYLNSTAKHPVIFGLLTTENMEQAEARAGGKLGNKGAECAVDAIKMIDFTWCVK
ncbi:MAG: 6,7-dimethyl-8-ribityllumazine synthase [Prevotellaceae bacterium]|jgi:6,7-dimethyl-8-ribityllumazine synthase|nr:6,7-dimethyl-8-ribityllumazine synthase [Prevotellaceae bacterium]